MVNEDVAIGYRVYDLELNDIEAVVYANIIGPIISIYVLSLIVYEIIKKRNKLS